MKKEKPARLNQQIRAKEVRLIDENDTQKGVVSIEEALDLANQAGLDLVEVSPHAKPPVCKILDWGKYTYQKTKQLQQGKKKQKSVSIKQIRFGLKIGEHDFNIKLKKIRDFLEDGHIVRVSAFFRGREMAHKELGHDLLKKVVDAASDISTVDQPASMSGKQLTIVLRSTQRAEA
ncbi:translation initiation factor IF-3 [Candidatus Saccharibacteria bacterium]|nr:translation initiation factor IF-3 [Candidatus Saccharibacteria bacterium]MBP9131540.1 translation initiation factor IF-3 [Candidatus Saccharibacteria bacterium]